MSDRSPGRQIVGLRANDDLAPLLPTFRDAAGCLVLSDKVARRWVRPPFDLPLLDFLESDQARHLADVGDIIATRVSVKEPLQLEHPRVPFVSYPWEWPSAMWIAAGDLTLRLCLTLLEQGRSLRDATPLNVLFQGTRPTLVDVLSVGMAVAGERTWPAYGQFVRTFLLPLLASRELGWPLPATINRRDGYEPEELWPHLSMAQRLRRAAFATVTLPSLLGWRQSKGGVEHVKPAVAPTADLELTRFTLERSIRGLQKTLHLLEPKATQTEWTEYASQCTHYSQEDQATKRKFVQTVLRHTQPGRVLDIGCNTGEYSLLAAESGAYVVGIESDECALNKMYTRVLAGRHAGSITLVHANLARPTPATGWLNRESFSLLERCRNAFDLCLLLAVVHHFLLREQIPLEEIAALCAEMTRADLVAEWVPPQDSMFRSYMRGRESLYGHLTEADFLEAFSPWFDVVRSQTLDNARRMIHLRRKLTAVST